MTLLCSFTPSSFRYEITRSVRSLPFSPSRDIFILLICHVTASNSLSNFQIPPLEDHQFVFSAVYSSISVNANAFKSSSVPNHFSLFFVKQKLPYKIFLTHVHRWSEKAHVRRPLWSVTRWGGGGGGSGGS